MLLIKTMQLDTAQTSEQIFYAKYVKNVVPV